MALFSWLRLRSFFTCICTSPAEAPASKNVCAQSLSTYNPVPVAKAQNTLEPFLQVQQIKTIDELTAANWSVVMVRGNSDGLGNLFGLGAEWVVMQFNTNVFK